MNREEAAKEIEKLKQEILKHEKAYYLDDNPLITDAEFDKLMNRLKSLENDFPELISPDSPTMRVGGKAENSFSQVKHEIPMLSLENCYSPEEFTKWYERISSVYGDFETVIEAKIDGLSCSLEYEDGILVRASTRGDGVVGEDVTANVRTVRTVPLKIEAPKNSKLEIRGEIYLDKKDFEKINANQSMQGLPLFSNPRNAAAGSLRQKDSSVTAKRNLKFFAHSFGISKNISAPSSHWDYLNFCSSLGFKVTEVRKLCKNLKEISDFYLKYEKERFELDYEIDGLVVKANSQKLREELGFTAKSPRWAIAFKYPASQAETKVNNVIFSVGRTGIVTPVAQLEPVKCAGVIISNSTLHNFDEIKRLDLRIGDRVLIERAGEVIPKVVRVLKEKRNGNEKEIKEPLLCPVCSSPLERPSGEVALKCFNSLCPAQIRASILHFSSRDAMNIEGLGEAVCDQMLSLNLIKDFADIYFIKKEDLLLLELFKNKKAENLLSQIEESKKRNLDKLIYALGIKHVGEKTALILAERFLNLEKLAESSLEEISQINEIGPTIANAVVSFFSSPQASALIEKLKKAGVNFNYVSDKKSSRFSGLSFVFTGELKTMTRDEAAAIVRKMGGKESSSVSSKTSYVVAGENPGSKYDKAFKLKVKIINEEEFLKLVKENEG
ncbi:MAG: NAD-dependent DNA ligase LigA [Elusimicrobia bacterium]|nr:NAD-dependent DNA ligase LigA [Elusimicrobiota bacterium]